MTVPLLDANVLLRHFTQDHAAHSPRASAFMQTVFDGQRHVRVVDQAIFEVGHTLLGMYKASRETFVDWMLPVIDLPTVSVRNKAVWARTFDVFTQYRALSLVDAFQVAMTEHWGDREIISFDTDFDAIPTITRIEP